MNNGKWTIDTREVPNGTSLVSFCSYNRMTGTSRVIYAINTLYCIK